MTKATITFGIFATAMAIADLIHGPHNGDRHRFYIHIFEFIAFMGLISLLEVTIFKWFDRKYKFNRWLSITAFSVITAVASFALFGIAGGGVHGDGGPIASSFMTYGTLASITFPIALIGFIVVAIIRFREGKSIADQ